MSHSPSTAERNAIAVRELYAALSRGDLPAAAASLAPDARLHVPGRGPNTGTYSGPDGVLEFVGRASAATEGTLRLDVHRVLADDEVAVALVTYTATRPGVDVQLTNHLAHVCAMRDGQVVESWFHTRDQYEVDAFWNA
ncbi:nuclear transport factor 2 family protein [Angustibacter aerolatus]